MNKVYSMILALSLFSSLAQAGDDHNHEASIEVAPRGGILRDALPYKAELLLSKDEVKIYIYEKTGKDLKLVSLDKLKKEIKARLAFPKDKKKREVIFVLKENAYMAKIPGIEKVHRYDLHVTLEVEGKPILADFGVDNIN